MIDYKNIIPWGRSYTEYVNMFHLSPGFLSKKVLGCGDGPAAFNAVANAFGGHVVSVDPIFELSKDEIEKQINNSFSEVINQTRANMEQFNWEQFGTLEGLGKIRMKSMKQFLNDYKDGKKEGRYIEASLPELPFADNSFDIALSSHFLLLYSDILDLDFHLKAIDEMLRISSEVRIFPIVDLNSKLSVHLPEILERYPNHELVKVNYEFQKGGNQMLKISH
ncbi:MAG TPA: methyltransferase domain-containing protein [Prolixibacteraceae bacterium]|nr:methyltransferase domain-containing protein [Prolixibacteraceae bacterium]